MLLSKQIIIKIITSLMIVFLYCSTFASPANIKPSNQTFATEDCCLNYRGNIDNDIDDIIDISDLIYLIDYSFGNPSGPEPLCFAEADIDGSGFIDISDIVQLVSYMFNDGTPPSDCSYVPQELVLNLNTKLHIFMSEDVSDGNSKLVLSFVTEQIYGCINYQVGYFFNQSGNAITLYFSNIYIEFICYTAMGPASGYQQLGNLPNGIYLLSMNNGELYTFQLTVTDTYYEITGSDERQFIISNPILFKTP